MQSTERERESVHLLRSPAQQHREVWGPLPALGTELPAISPVTSSCVSVAVATTHKGWDSSTLEQELSDVRHGESGRHSVVDGENAEFRPRLHPQELATPPKRPFANARGDVAKLGFKVRQTELSDFGNVVNTLQAVVISGWSL